MNRIVRVFLDTNLACSHPGLSSLAMKNKIDVRLLDAGSFIIFLNRRKTAFKLFAPNNTIVYYKSPQGRVDLNAIKYIPHVFNAKAMSIDFDTAQLMALKEKPRHNLKG